MKVGLDIDGTITDAKELFMILSDALIRFGHEVHIITYRDDIPSTLQELKEWGIRYTEVHFPGSDDEHHLWKGKLAEKIGLDVMFDDSPEVLDNMPGNVKRLWFCDPEVFNLKAAIVGLRADARMGVIG